ncbi:hypothetical protein ILYODFUR_025102 [Ilyodon furcidens]|uniref:Uncharacterized protein n=1 Tax=Ilyodon furcidens TaxID=33524 RepID=A0ABV0TXH9_9TELE
MIMFLRAPRMQQSITEGVLQFCSSFMHGVGCCPTVMLSLLQSFCLPSPELGVGLGLGLGTVPFTPKASVSSNGRVCSDPSCKAHRCCNYSPVYSSGEHPGT